MVLTDCWNYTDFFKFTFELYLFCNMKRTAKIVKSTNSFCRFKEVRDKRNLFPR